MSSNSNQLETLAQFLLEASEGQRKIEDMEALAVHVADNLKVLEGNCREFETVISKANILQLEREKVRRLLHAKGSDMREAVRGQKSLLGELRASAKQLPQIGAETVGRISKLVSFLLAENQQTEQRFQQSVEDNQQSEDRMRAQVRQLELQTKRVETELTGVKKQKTSLAARLLDVEQKYVLATENKAIETHQAQELMASTRQCSQDLAKIQVDLIDITQSFRTQGQSWCTFVHDAGRRIKLALNARNQSYQEGRVAVEEQRAELTRLSVNLSEATMGAGRERTEKQALKKQLSQLKSDHGEQELLRQSEIQELKGRVRRAEADVLEAQGAFSKRAQAQEAQEGRIAALQTQNEFLNQKLEQLQEDLKQRNAQLTELQKSKGSRARSLKAEEALAELERKFRAVSLGSQELEEEAASARNAALHAKDLLLTRTEELARLTWAMEQATIGKNIGPGAKP